MSCDSHRRWNSGKPCVYCRLEKLVPGLDPGLTWEAALELIADELVRLGAGNLKKF